MKQNDLYFNQKTGEFILSINDIKSENIILLSSSVAKWELDIFKTFLGVSRNKQVFDNYSKSYLIKEYLRFENMCRFMGEMGYVFYAP